MGNLTFVVKDSGTGKPIKNAEVIANVSNKPCGTFAIGCSSGSPYVLNDYTDSSGSVSFSLRYNTSASVQFQALATNYNTQTGEFSISGANLMNENVWYTKDVELVADTSNQVPPNEGTLANVTSSVNTPAVSSFLEDIGYSATNAGYMGSIELTIIVVVVAIAVIIGLIAMVVLS